MDPASADAAADARSRGTVAVHEADSDVSARDVAGRLMAAGIPAAVEHVRADAAWVIVPWDRHVETDALLRRWGLTVIPRFGAGGEFEVPNLRRTRPALGVVPSDEPLAQLPVRRESLETDDEDDDGPVEVPLPESGPLLPRVVVALAAIGFGIGVQRLVEALFGGSGAPAMAARGLDPADLWRLVTAGFYHFSLEHLASNLAFGLMFGVVLFGTHGVGATMAAWLFGSVVGIGTEILGSPVGVLVGGASAGNYALVGLWAKGQHDRGRRAFLPRRERLKALGVVLFLAPGALTPVTQTGTKVAVIAHAIGFLAGVLAGVVFERRVAAHELPAIERRSSVGQWCALAVVALGFAMAARAWALALTASSGG